MPQFSAASTAARSSASVKVDASSGLCGEATPPPAVSLICVAPSMSCSRTRTPDLIRTVGDHAAAESAPSRDCAAAEVARHLERLAKVAVTAGDRDDGAGGIDARSGDDALVDRTLEPEGRPAHVADGGEAAHERVRGLGTGQQVEVADVAGEQGCGGGPHQHRVPVHVDQPGHQRPPAADDDLGIGTADRP